MNENQTTATLVEKEGKIGEVHWNTFEGHTYHCGNCGCPRAIETWTVEQCKNCGDDEFDTVTLEVKFP